MTTLALYTFPDERVTIAVAKDGIYRLNHDLSLTLVLGGFEIRLSDIHAKPRNEDRESGTS